MILEWNSNSLNLQGKLKLLKKKQQKNPRKLVCKTNIVIRPTHINFPIGRESVACCGSKLITPGLRVTFPQQICVAAINKETIFCSFFRIFELGGITKHKMTGPVGNSEFSFPLTSMFPQ